MGKQLELSGCSRRALKLARLSARSLGHPLVGTEHLLIGLLEGGGTAYRVLDDHGLCAAGVRQASGPAWGPSAFGREPRASLRLSEALGRARREARRLGHSQVRTEHLLLGLTRVPRSGANRVLERVGVSRVRLQRGVFDVLREVRKPFAREARLALKAADREASRLGHGWIGTEHVLIGLSNQRRGVAALTLHEAGLRPCRIRNAVRRLVTPGGGCPTSEPRRATPLVREVLADARRQAALDRSSEVSAPHLLRALLGLPHSVAARAIRALRVDPRRVAASRALRHPHPVVRVRATPVVYASVEAPPARAVPSDEPPVFVAVPIPAEVPVARLRLPRHPRPVRTRSRFVACVRWLNWALVAVLICRVAVLARLMNLGY